jgi:hypothetical protein
MLSYHWEVSNPFLLSKYKLVKFIKLVEEVAILWNSITYKKIGEVSKPRETQACIKKQHRDGRKGRGSVGMAGQQIRERDDIKR